MWLVWDMVQAPRSRPDLRVPAVARTKERGESRRRPAWGEITHGHNRFCVYFTACASCRGTVPVVSGDHRCRPLASHSRTWPFNWECRYGRRLKGLFRVELMTNWEAARKSWVFNGPRGLIVCVEVKEGICDTLTTQISTAASSFTPRESPRV